ncbi:polyribonucleotide nucleotidyltransferase [Chloroflexota bacterium]
MLESRSFECNIGGRNLIMETGVLAGQADAAVTISCGETVVLVTVCFANEPREGVDFLPLTIDYEERMYAAGKIPGGFIRREGRPSEDAILACRLADRPLRPLLPKTWRNEIQVIATVLSVDQENDPDTLGVIGASAVLSLSAIPFLGPVGAVHVGYIDGELVVNPVLASLGESQLDLIVASTKDAVIMLEAGAKEVSEEIVMEAIRLGHEANQDIIRVQEEMQQALGKPKLEATVVEENTGLVSAVSGVVDQKLAGILLETDKEQRERALADLKKDLVMSLGESFSERDMLAAFDTRFKSALRANILGKSQRYGGRGLTEIRPISCEVGKLPRTHGSGLFNRGQTQVLSITTLGSTKKEQMLDGIGIEDSKRFIHHYNFTPFSSGEVRRVGSPSRRAIGHGALAERALVPMLSLNEDFPYAVRLVSEVLSSNGSTSMASVCAGSLSLMDAGVPMKSAVAGVAMGLVTGDDDRFAVLTDIEGLEDAFGDMDFKVAGTEDGITAIQMDTKIKGLSMDIIEKTVAQAKDGRLFILGKMAQTISSSRSEVNHYAPRMHKIKIDSGKIGAIIGSGGKTIRSIQEQTKTTIDISDDGTVVVGSADMESSQRAIAIIEGLTREAEIGDVYTGKVTRILDFGAMVEVLPGKEGLVHISELEDYRVGKVEDVVKVGEEVTVKVINIDNMGRVNLSRRALLDNSGAGGGDSKPPDNPSRGSDNRPPQSRYPTGSRPRYSGGSRPPGPGSVPPRNR